MGAKSCHWPGSLDHVSSDAGNLYDGFGNAFPACHAACSRRAASSPPALETPVTPAEADVTARDAEIGRARAVDDAALRLVVQRNDSRS